LNYKFVVVLALVMVGCASTAKQEGGDNTQITVTGTRASSSDFHNGKLTVVEPEEGETRGEMLIRLLGGADLPKSNSFSNCQELLTIIKQNESVKISSITDTLVIASAGSATVEYEFPGGGCR